MIAKQLKTLALGEYSAHALCTLTPLHKTEDAPSSTVFSPCYLGTMALTAGPPGILAGSLIRLISRWPGILAV